RLYLGHVPHLAARPRRPLAVEVHRGARNRQPARIIVDVVADQIGHGDLAVADGLAQRPPGNRPDMLLALRDRCAVQRPVSAIVSARPYLLYQHLLALSIRNHEHLHREPADIIERSGDLFGNATRLGGQRVRDVGGRSGDLENVIAMLVFGDVIAFDVAIGGARRDDRDFALERDEGLEDGGFGAELIPDALDVVALADDGLALAVIAEAAGFVLRRERRA